EALTPPETLHTRARVELHPPSGKGLDERVEGELEYWAAGATHERRELVTSRGDTVVQVVDGPRCAEVVDGKPTGRDVHADFAQKRLYVNLLLALAAEG